MRGQVGIEQVESRMPSLEEIFVAYVSPEQGDVTSTPAEEEVTP